MKEIKTMKIKTPLTLAALLVAGLLATGCQQMQQTAGASQQQTAAPETKTTDTKAPSTNAVAGSHSHPAIPGCTNSVTHTHPTKDPNHNHAYGCKGGVPHIGGGQGKGPAVPQVKAKGKYKGPVSMDKKSQQLMQQYQQK